MQMRGRPIPPRGAPSRLVDQPWRERARREASQAKVIATETLQFVTDHGMQLMGSAGYSAESDMQRYWRDARLYSFGEGANEIHRDQIARELGL